MKEAKHVVAKCKYNKVTNKLNVYLEVGSRRTFAAALDWPGWCRMGRDQAAALRTLFEYGPRYARIVRPARLGFQAPDDVSAFAVVERLQGNATTDFGAPGLPPASDAQPVDNTELRRLQTLLKACWRAFDAAVEMAEGKALLTGPRGGGRTLDGVVQHVLGAELGYLSQLGGKLKSESAPPSPRPLRQAILKTLSAAARGEIAAYGPRGGKRWSPRYFVRREAWHVLDHTWELQDRLK
jgi:hypothetical protein